MRTANTLFFGRLTILGTWGPESELIASVLSALMLGVVLSYITNSDILHRALRKAGLSNRSAHTAEWYVALSERPRYVVIHFKDERRLYGWPTIWPSDPEKGHFLIDQPSWLDMVGKQNDQAECLLVDARDVRWVEFVKKPEN